MNTLRVFPVSSVLTAALLGAALSPSAQAQSSQRVEVTAAPAPTWVRDGDSLMPYVPFFGLRTREEVRAELMDFLARGGHAYSDANLVDQQPFVSTRTRVEVRAEAIAARERGDYVSEGDALVFRSPPASVSDSPIVMVR